MPKLYMLLSKVKDNGNSRIMFYIGDFWKKWETRISWKAGTSRYQRN